MIRDTCIEQVMGLEYLWYGITISRYLEEEEDKQSCSCSRTHLTTDTEHQTHKPNLQIENLQDLYATNNDIRGRNQNIRAKCNTGTSTCPGWQTAVEPRL